jgi:hypothetical protein
MIFEADPASSFINLLFCSLVNFAGSIVTTDIIGLDALLLLKNDQRLSAVHTVLPKVNFGCNDFMVVHQALVSRGNTWTVAERARVLIIEFR